MKRALSIVIAGCLVATVADAQTSGTPPTPRVVAPVTFALDTVLFRLPRAELSPTALVTLRASAPQRLYSRGLYGGVRWYTATRCVRMKGLSTGVIEGFPKMRTDSTMVAAIRPSMGECPKAPSF